MTANAGIGRDMRLALRGGLQSFSAWLDRLLVDAGPSGNRGSEVIRLVHQGKTCARVTEAQELWDTLVATRPDPVILLSFCAALNPGRRVKDGEPWIAFMQRLHAQCRSLLANDRDVEVACVPDILDMYMLLGANRLRDAMQLMRAPLSLLGRDSV